MNLWKRSLLAQLVSYFSLLSVVTVCIVAIAAYNRARDSLQQSVLDRLTVATSLKAFQLDDWVDNQQRDVLLVSQMPEVRDRVAILVTRSPGDPQWRRAYAELSDHLLELIEIKPNLSSVTITTNGGFVVYSSSDKDIEGRYKSLGLPTTYFTQQNAGSVVPNFYTAASERGETAAITFATPLLDEEGVQMGAIAIDLNLNVIDQLIRENTGLGDTAETYLVGRTGNNVVFISRDGSAAASNNDANDESENIEASERAGRTAGSMAEKTVSSPGIDAAIARENVEGLAVNYDGVPVVGVYRWLTSQNLALVAEISQREAFLPARELAREILLIGLSSAVLLLVMVYLLSRRISQPILAIAYTAIDVAKGDLNLRAPVLTEDEIGILARAFNKMTAQLRQSNDQLADYSRTLEQRIQDSTQDLQDTLTYLSSIIDNMADGLLVTNKAGDITRCNPVLMRMFQLSGDDIIGKPCADVFGEDIARLVAQTMQAQPVQVQTSQAQTVQVESEVLTEAVALRENRIGKASATPIVKKTPGTHWVQVGDKTIRAEPDRSEADVSTQSALNPSATHNSGNGDYNETSSAHPGSTPELGHSESAEREAAVLCVEEVDAHDSVSHPIAQDYLGAIVLIQDVTDEREIDRMKTDFISTVSHELRTPLTSVLGFAKIIKRKLQDTLLPQIRADDRKTQRTVRQVSENLDIIVSEGERLTALINDVLDIAKIEAGRVDWHMQTLRVPDLIDRAIAATRSLFEQKQLVLHREVAPDLPTLEGDRDRLIQVIINLLSNAVKFTEQGAVICRAQQAGDRVIVSVIDSGIGIATADQSKVFDKFRQVGDTLTDKPQGTGLGLPICKQIIEHHGGTIGLESELGRGSTFSFSLPVRAAETLHSQSASEPIAGDNRPLWDQSAAVRKPADSTLNLAASHTDSRADCQHPSSLEEGCSTLDTNELFKRLKRHVHLISDRPDSTTKNILVVDDDINIRKLLRQELEAEDYRVREASNGLEAIAHIKQERPDLIITDVCMPELGGFEMTTQIKNDPAFKTIPVIVLSILEDKEQGFRVGVDRYFTKPISSERLLHAVGQLISKQTSRKTILVVDEDVETVKHLANLFRARDFQVIEAFGTREFIQQARTHHPDMVIAHASYASRYEIVKSLRFEQNLDHLCFFLLADQQMGDELNDEASQVHAESPLRDYHS